MSTILNDFNTQQIVTQQIFSNACFARYAILVEQNRTNYFQKVAV
jgi:hypothetical protein